MIRRLLCRILGHDWDGITDGTHTIGHCWRCQRFELNPPELEGRQE